MVFRIYIPGSYGKKCVIAFSVLVMLFMPPTMGQGGNAVASLDFSSTNNRQNIPIVVPFENPDTEGYPTSDTDSRSNMASQSAVEGAKDFISTLATCDQLQVSSATANGNDGNIPSNVLDNILNTRWSNLGQGSWIQLDLGSKKSICSVDIAWYPGNQRQNNFIISVSDDGTTFTQKHSGTSSGTTTSPERYTLPTGTEGRYIRITVNGNTQNEWASITEISLLGGTSGSGGGCNQLQVSSATANGNDGNIPSNVLDNILNTRWSNLGQGSWIQLDLGSKKSICSVDIAWYLGNQRQNNFIISVSDDGTTFTQKHSGTSSGTTTSPERYTLPTGTEGRYIRITVNGNTQNEWASITQISVLGQTGSTSTNRQPTADSKSVTTST